MILVKTPSRLHFGLLNPAGAAGRRFGGVGLMIQAPHLELSMESGDDWSVEGCLAYRAREFLRKLLDSYLGTRVRPQAIRIHHAPPEHKGLGTGTQLALALARGLAEEAGAELKAADELAPLVGRGARSALGIHGFDRGGFLVEGGKWENEEVAPLVSWIAFPPEWRIVLTLPPWPAGLHGQREIDAFNQLRVLPGHTDALCRHVLLELLPALTEADFEVFAECLHHFNRLAGESFWEVQGSAYANARVAELIEYVRRLGVKGVGQSSWGPAVFALAPDEDRALWLSGQIREHLRLTTREVLVTTADNHGARVWKGDPTSSTRGLKMEN